MHIHVLGESLLLNNYILEAIEHYISVYFNKGCDSTWGSL